MDTLVSNPFRASVYTMSSHGSMRADKICTENVTKDNNNVIYQISEIRDSQLSR
jgi:hypothetical protein